jgi:ABC-2 type transport system permease protein
MVKKHFIELSRYPIEFITSFGIVFLFILMFAFSIITFLPFEKSKEMMQIGAITLYGFVIFMLFSSTMWDIGFSIRNEQIRGTLETLYLTPANKFSNLSSRAFASLCATAFICLAAFVFVTKIFGPLPIQNILLGIYILFFTTLACLGISFFIAALTLKLKQSIAFLINSVQFISIILCAMFFPFKVLPPQVLIIAKLIPLSYCVDAFRTVMMGTPQGFPELLPFNIELLIITAFGILCIMFGYWFYKRQEYKARQDGTLVEY